MRTNTTRKHRRTPGGNLMPAPRERISATTGKVTSLQVNSPNFKVNGVLTNEKIPGKTIEALMANYDRWILNHPDRTMVARGTETVESFGRWWLTSVVAHDVDMGILSPATLVNYRMAFEKRVCDEKIGCGWLRVRSTKAEQEASHETLTDWVKRMQKAGVPLPTMMQAVKMVRALGRAMVEHASKSGAAKNPAKFLEYPATDKRTARSVEEVVTYETNPQVTALLIRASEQLPVHLSGLWTIATGTGLRRGELCGLLWEHIDFEGGWIKVIQQVTAVDRQLVLGRVKNDNNHRGRRVTPAPKLVPLEPRVAAVLLRMKAAQEMLAKGKGWGKDAADPERTKLDVKGWVFSEDGLVMRPSRLHYLFGTVKKAAIKLAEALPDTDIERMTLHKGRHDFISYLMRAGLAPDQISQYARHKDPQTIFRAGYVHSVKRADEGRAAIGRGFDLIEQAV